MQLIEGDIAWNLSPRAHPLGRRLDGGGSGNVYSLPEPRPLAAKIYGDGVDRAMYERKLAAMIDLPPELDDIVDGNQRHVRIAWPVAALRDGQRLFAGFLMPAVDLGTTSELEWILQERQARAMGLPLGLAAKISIAANIASTIAELHHSGHRVIDLNPAKFRFHAQSLHTTMFDCDSFSIQGKNERFAAKYAATGQLTTDYLAPEFHDQPIPPAGEESQDRFALAVLVFQLLNFGIHPFTGRPTDDRVPTDVPGRIAQRFYPYGSNPNPYMEPNPVSGHLAMPAELRSLFDRAFEGDGAERPAASEWSTLLMIHAMPSNKCLQPCAAVAGHQHYADLPCAACARAELIVGAANASNMSLEYVEDPMAEGVQAFGAPAPVTDAVPASSEWHAAIPMHMPLPPEPVEKGLPKGVITTIKVAAVVALAAIAISQGVAYRARHAPQPLPAVPFRAEAVDPPGVPRPDPDLAGFPAMEQEEALTEGYATNAARAIARGNHGAWETAMATLRSRVPAHQLSAPDAQQAAFATFSSSFTPETYSERQRQDLIRDLRQTLRFDPFDDEAAVELGWLSLLGGERDAARSFYAHAIWVNPDRANAWYGFAVVARDEDQISGALAIAELLTSDPALAQHMRDAFPPLLLRLCAIKPEYFAMLQSRARVIAEQNRPASPSPDTAPPASNASSPR